MPRCPPDIPDPPSPDEAASAIRDAIRAKREKHSPLAEDIERMEASLIADIEAFDLDAARRRAEREELTRSGAGMSDPNLVFPDIVPAGVARSGSPAVASAPTATATTPPQGSLLDQLRRQAEHRQQTEHQTRAERNQAALALDQTLKQVFFYLHEFVQQLNILKPPIERRYPLVDQLSIDGLHWREGFADYRTQTQSKGALLELVSLSFHLAGAGSLVVEREAGAVDRFRNLIFDAGLTFTCNEMRNARRLVERAEFTINRELGVSVRWRADFERACLVVETRNFERLGAAQFVIAPAAVDRALLDAFGALVLCRPSPFRTLARRE